MYRPPALNSIFRLTTCLGLVSAMPFLHAGTVQTTGFEPGEGFVPGMLNGQGIWSAADWAVSVGGLDTGVAGTDEQHAQLVGPASSGQRAFAPLASAQTGTVYARVDFRYKGNYDYADFFWMAFSAGSGDTDNASLGIVLRSAQPNSLQFYARSTSSGGTKSNSTDYVTHIYSTAYTLVLKAEKTGTGPTAPYDKVSIYVNPDLGMGSSEPASVTAKVTASIGNASLNGIFFRVGDADSLDSGESILIDSIEIATDWTSLTREVIVPDLVGEPAQTDIDSIRPWPATVPDFDNDGVSDTVERALGRDPWTPDSPAAVFNTIELAPSYMNVTYDRTADSAPYTVLIEGSADLSEWDTTGINQEAGLSTASDGRSRITARIPRPDENPLFARMQIMDTRLIDELDQAAVSEFFAMTLSWWSQYVNAAGTKDTYGSISTWDYEWIMRMLVPMAAWLSQPGRSESVTWNGTTVNVADALRNALVNGTDPSHSDRWPTAANSGDQIIVEAPQVAYALWLLYQAKLDGAPGGAVWDSFTSAQLADMQAFLEATANPSWSYYNNWNLFIVVNHEARKRLQLAAIPEFDTFSQSAIDNRLADVQGFHKGGGWYADHESDSVFDDYLPWALLPDQMVIFMMGHADSQAETVIPNTDGRGRSQILADAASWLNDHIRMFDAFGGNPEYGRSNSYKFARLRAIVTAYAIDRFHNTSDQWNLGFSVLPSEIGPGTLRRLVRLHLNHYLKNGIVNANTGELQNGQTPDSSSQTLEPYTHDGSRYWALFPIGTLLLLPDDDPLWTSPEKPLPAETHAYEYWFQPPGLLVRNAPGAGHLELFNARAERPSWTNTSYTPKYNKYAYSTHFGYCTPSGTRLDQSISISGAFRDNPANGDYFLPADRQPDEPGVIRTTHIQGGATVKTLIFLKDDLQVRVNRITGASGLSVEEAGYPLGHNSGENPPAPVSGTDWTYMQSSDGAVMTARLHGFTSLELVNGTGSHSRKARWRLPYARLDSSSPTQDTAILLVARRASFNPEAVRGLVQSVSFEGNVVTVNWSDGASTAAEFGP